MPDSRLVWSLVALWNILSISSSAIRNSELSPFIESARDPGTLSTGCWAWVSTTLPTVSTVTLGGRGTVWMGVVSGIDVVDDVLDKRGNVADFLVPLLSLPLNVVDDDVIEETDAVLCCCWCFWSSSFTEDIFAAATGGGGGAAFFLRPPIAVSDVADVLWLYCLMLGC